MDKKYQKRIFNGKILSKHKFSGLTLVTLRAFFCMRRCPFLRCAGFTLLELLVVVLIIGILAAIAYPQYEIAIMKSKMNTALPLMRAIKEANERYYMNNGKYTDDLGLLDVDLPKADRFSNEVAGQVCFSNGVGIDNLGGGSIHYIIGGIGCYWRNEKTCWITMYYDDSTKAGIMECGTKYSSHPKCERVCKSLGY